MGVVESTVVLNARDNTKSALSSVQKSIEQLAHESAKLQKSFEEFDLTGLEGFTKEVYQTQNNIGNLTNLLSHFTQGSQEYNNVQKMLADEQERLNKLFEESADRQMELADQRLQEIQAGQEEVQVKSSLIDKLKEMGLSIADNTQKLFGNREQTMSNSEAVKYREGRISALKKSIEEQNIVLANSKVKYGENSVEVRRVEENLAELNQELKENKQRLKEATINVSPFQMALEKLGRNIKSLFFLQAGKAILDTTRKLIQAGINEFIEGGLKMEAVVEQFDYLAQRGGMSAIELRNSLREASRGMVADTDLMQSANKAMMLGVGQNIEMMSNLMKVAQVRAAAMNETTTKAFDDIVLGIGRLSPKILDNLGIIVNLNDAYSVYADKIGKSVKELSKAEQQMAVYDAVMEKSRTELEARGRDNLSVADKIQILKVKAVNSIDVIGGAFMRRIEPLIEGLGDILDKGTEVADDLSAEMDSATHNIRVGISSLLGNIFDDVVEVGGETRDVIKETTTNIFNNLLELGNWFLSFFGDTQDNAQITSQNVGDYLLLMINAVGDGVVGLTKAFANLRDWVSWGLGTAKNTFQKVKAGLANVYNTKDSELSKGGFFDTVSKKFKEGYNSVKDTTRDIEQVLTDHQGVWNNFTLEVMKKEEKLANSLVEGGRYSASKAGDRIDALFGGDDPDDKTKGGSGGSKGGKSGKSDAEKDMENRVKQMKKDLEDLQKFDSDNLKALDNLARQELSVIEKNISDINKKREDQFNDLQKLIDDTEKRIDKLNQEIANLQQKLKDLKVDENKSIAQEVIKARDELKKLEEQYEGLKETAESVSMADLEGKGGVGKFDVDLIKKYKEYQDELAGMYSGMTTEEQAALDKEIEYAQWYDSLNGIEKIKEDYRIRREEIQNELNEKYAALNSEQTLLRQYKAEQKKLQAERIKEIEAEEKKYKTLYDNLVLFEQNYYQKRDDNHQKMMKSLNDLEQKRIAVARAKERAMNAGGGNYFARAIGGPVREQQPYLVGETGPELFIPNSAGRIVNNQDLNRGGNQPINITIEMGGVVLNSEVDKDELLNDMEERLIRKLQLYKKGIYV